MERHGGDGAVALALVEAARGAGFAHARAGVAGSCIAAAAATRERGSPWRVVPPGGDARYLRRRPLALLPLPSRLRAALAELGLRTCGELADLSAADVELRFGTEGFAAWRLARADDPRWPFRPAAPGEVRAEAELDAPVEGAEPLRFLLAGLVASVVAQLGERQRIPAALRLVLRLDGAPTATRPVRPARPTADARVLAELCRRALEGEPLARPVSGIALEVEAEGTARADQLDVFRPPAPDPAALHAALVPVFARWGEGALSRAEHRGAHLPAEHAAWTAEGPGGIAAFAAEAPPGPGREGVLSFPRAELPLCLRRLPEPLPVRVRAGPDGAPAEVALPVGLGSAGGSYPPGVWKTSAAGPERISGAWWSQGSAREYWRVESREGWLGLVFRDAASGGWFLEGWYD